MYFKHPSNVCMTYFNHLCFSFRLSIAFFYGGICSIIHGIYPDILENSSTKTVMFIQKKIKESGCRKGTNVPFIIEKKDISVVTDKLNESSTNIESPTKDWDFCSDPENV